MAVLFRPPVDTWSNYTGVSPLSAAEDELRFPGGQILGLHLKTVKVGVSYFVAKWFVFIAVAYFKSVINVCAHMDIRKGRVNVV